MSERIFLFDLDGVLIQPGGYRAAVRATLNQFASQIGQGAQGLGEEAIAIFESLGITSEWDMIPLSLVILLDQAAAQDARFSRWASFEQAAREATAAALPPLSVDYASAIRQLRTYLAPPMAPSDAILLNLHQNRGRELFPHLLDLAIFEDLLGCTRDLRRCPTSAVFQNYILGNRLYAQTYGTVPRFEVESYLAQFDTVLVSAEWRERLLREVRSRRLRTAAITARPSLPPIELPDVSNGFSPEAEQALAMMGFAGFPLMGYGGVLYLAQQLDISAELLLKPSPVQALGALLVALGEKPWPALLEAAQLAGIGAGQLKPPAGGLLLDHFRPESSFSIHIFEDSPVGIQATQAAAQILKTMGVQVELSVWGITQNPDKQAALERLGARVFPHIDLALPVALG